MRRSPPLLAPRTRACHAGGPLPGRAGARSVPKGCLPARGKPGPGPAELVPAPRSPAPDARLSICQEHCGNRGHDESYRGAQQFRMRCPDCWWWIHFSRFLAGGSPAPQTAPKAAAEHRLPAGGWCARPWVPRTVGIGRYPPPPPGERACAGPRTRARCLTRSPAGCPINARSFLRTRTIPVSWSATTVQVPGQGASSGRGKGQSSR